MLFSLFTFRKENLAALLWTGHGAGQCHQLHLSVVLAGLPTLGVCACDRLLAYCDSFWSSALPSHSLSKPPQRAS